MDKKMISNRFVFIIAAVMLAVALVIPGAAIATGTSATRTLPASVAPGANFDVSIQASGCGTFGQVVETLPNGFGYVSCPSTDVFVTPEDSTVKFTFIGDSVSFDYTVTASTTGGSYSFSGAVKDEDKVEYTIGGDTDITVAPAEEASATRTLPASVAPGADFDVGIEASGCGTFGQVVETLPDGFGYVSTDSTDVTVTQDGNTISFTFIGDAVSFDYTVTASTTAGSYSFSGVVKDEDKVEYTIGGDTDITVALAEEASATRTLPASVAPGADFDVGIEASGCGTFGQVVETLPDGFGYVSTDSTDVTVTQDGNTISFTFIGDAVSFDYTVTASTTAGSYSFSGVVKDEDKVEYTIGGEAEIVVGPTLESIAAEPSEVSLYVDETQQLTVTATYSDESIADVTAEAGYESSEPSVATVSDIGLITAVAEGSATVTASYTEDAITKTAEVPVTVSALTIVTEEFTGTLAKNERAYLTTIPEGATELEITLSATADIDLELYDGDTFVIGWKAIINSPGTTAGTYEGDDFAYSGWSGSEEYIRADGPLSRAYTLKVYGYQAGSYTVTVSYVPAVPPNPPPTIIIDVPATVALGNPVTVAVSASDPDGVARVEFMVSSPWPEEWSPASSNSQYEDVVEWVMSFDDEASLTFVPGWAGTYTVDAWACDQLGNCTPEATPATTTFVVAE